MPPTTDTQPSSALAVATDHDRERELAAYSGYSREDVELVKDQIAPGVSDGELKLFLAVCRRTGLDPFARQVYCIVRETYDRKLGRKIPKMTIQTSIDGARLAAARSGEYEGQTPPQWCATDGIWHEVWLVAEPPAAARVGVWRKGFREPVYGVCTWRSYAQTYDGKPTGLWDKMPDTMLAKVSEMLALRKAFPAELSGVYSAEEMAQADRVEDDEPAPRPIAGGGSAKAISAPTKPTARPVDNSVDKSRPPGTRPVDKSVDNFPSEGRGLLEAKARELVDFAKLTGTRIVALNLKVDDRNLTNWISGAERALTVSADDLLADKARLFGERGDIAESAATPSDFNRSGSSNVIEGAFSEAVPAGEDDPDEYGEVPDGERD